MDLNGFEMSFSQRLEKDHSFIVSRSFATPLCSRLLPRPTASVRLVQASGIAKLLLGQAEICQL